MKYEGDVGRALDMPALVWHRAESQRCVIELEGHALDWFEFVAVIGRQGEGHVLMQQAMTVERRDLGRQKLERWIWERATNHYEYIHDPQDTINSIASTGFDGSNPWTRDFRDDFARRGQPMPPWLSPFMDVRSRLAGTRIFRFSPTALRTPSAAAATAIVPQLEANGAGLPTLLSVLAGAEPERFRAIQQELTAAVPQLAGFKVLPTPQGGHRLVFTLAGSLAPLEASQVSDGALLFLAYASLVHHPEPPAVLLIEEPENGVHPSRLRTIAKLLRRLTEPSEQRPATQIIMTTHSPYLLDEHVQPDEAFFCHRDDSGAATVTRFDAIPDLEGRLADYSLGELWTAYGEKDLYERATRARGREP
jgi:hypothetical protein